MRENNANTKIDDKNGRKKVKKRERQENAKRSGERK